MTAASKRRRLTAVAIAIALSVGSAWAVGPQPPPAKVARHLFLTFDADMTPGMARQARAGTRWYDPAIIDYLRDNRVPAAIFVSGLFAEAYPDVVRRMAEDPLFEIGNHGYEHAAYAAPCYGLPILATDEAKRRDLREAQKALASVTGRTPARFRFPGLCHAPHDDDLVREAGLQIVASTLTSGDAFNPDTASIVAQVLRQARDQAVVVFHLGGPNAPATLAALKELVPALRARGYEISALGVRR